MRLYEVVSTESARHVVEKGFVGTVHPDEFDVARLAEGPLPEPTGHRDYCEFRDIPPVDLTPFGTAERQQEKIAGRSVRADDPGDFVLSIDVPYELARNREVFEDDPSRSWPVKLFFLSPDEANKYRDTLKVYDSEDGEEVRPDLIGK